LVTPASQTSDAMGDLAETVTDIDRVLDSTTDLANTTEDIVDGTADVTNAGDEVVDTLGDAFGRAKDTGYGPDADTFAQYYNEGKRFDEVSRRWVSDFDSPTQWTEYLSARSQGYTGKFVDFRAGQRSGQVFNAATGTMENAASSSTVTSTAEALTSGSSTVASTAEGSARSVAIAQLLEELRAYRYKDLGGYAAAAQAAYDSLKGVATSLWLVLNNGAPVNSLGGIAGIIMDRTAESDARIEQLTSAQSSP